MIGFGCRLRHLCTFQDVQTDAAVRGHGGQLPDAESDAATDVVLMLLNKNGIHTRFSPSAACDRARDGGTTTGEVYT